MILSILTLIRPLLRPLQCILLTIRVCVGSHKADPSPLKTRGQRKHDDHHSDEEPVCGLTLGLQLLLTVSFLVMFSSGYDLFPSG